MIGASKQLPGEVLGEHGLDLAARFVEKLYENFSLGGRIEIRVERDLDHLEFAGHDHPDAVFFSFSALLLDPALELAELIDLFEFIKHA